ncbi:MAG: GNAT family N-acetyltransferase [Phycisphaerales bacterium JB040]
MTAVRDDTGRDGSHGWSPPAWLDTSVRIDSERLVIRLYGLHEAPALLGSVDASRPEVEPWESWTRSFRTLDDAHRLVIRQRLRVASLTQERSLELGVFERESGSHVGGVGFHSIDTDTGQGEIGYWLRTDRCGRGLATEAVGRVVSWLLAPQRERGLGLARVVARCSHENTPSSRVCQRLGLPLELRQPGAYFVRGLGRVTDLLGYGVLADEWDTRQHRAKPGTPASRLPPALA